MAYISISNNIIYYIDRVLKLVYVKFAIVALIIATK